MSSNHQCLSEDTVFALVSGRFDEVRACALLAEAERCVDCSLLLDEAGRAIVEDGTDGSDTLPWLNGAGVLRIGSIVASRFRVLRLLGCGGMGEVYEALDNELGELVALKTIRTSHATLPASIERFRQEVRLARRVVHPHVCRVLEFGRDQLESGAPVYFLTMELLRGELLSRYLRRCGRLSSLESVAIARQITAGLSAIHAQGVLHRDIKPSNVMLCCVEGEVDAQGAAARRAVLLDFGIARSVALGTTARSHGALIGTPDYMAPEQLQAQALTPATDIYGLGMLLFELLVGELPFAEDPTLTRALKRLQGPPPVMTTHAAELSPKLARLVARCLEVAPGDRPHSMAALLLELTELEQELSGAPVASRPARAVGQPGSNLFARVSLLIACTILAGVAVVMALGAGTTRPSASVSPLPQAPLSRPASPSASAHASHTMPSAHASHTMPSAHASSPAPSSREPVLARDAAALLNEPHVNPPAQPGVPDSSKSSAPARRGTSSTGRALSPAQVKPSCSPPYYFDGEGFRVYRKECL